MPAISKIRLTNVVYENGDKRFNDELFLLNGENGAVLLENGGGKTVFIHTILQAVLPHTNLGERKIRETLQLDNAPAHIGIEWMINERPRRYVTTVVSLFLYNNTLDSYKYVYEYEEGNPDALAYMPFVKQTKTDKRPAYKEEMADYFSAMKHKTHNANTFDTIKSFHAFIEQNYQIITNEWESIVKINGDEGGIEKFFANCKTTTDLYDRLLIPTVEDSIAGHEKGMFADMFEKQRDGFQMYRNLQKSMEEHGAIQTELERYVAQFKVYSDEQMAYEQAKQRAKGIAEELTGQKVAMEKEWIANKAKWEALDEREANLHLQTESYNILQEQEKARRLENDYFKKLATYEEVTERLQKNENKLHSLQYAQAKSELQAHVERQRAYETELETYDKEGDVDDYEAQLEEENAKIHGYYFNQLELLEKTITNYTIEKRPLVEEVARLTAKKTKQQDALQAETKNVNIGNGKLETKEEHIDNLKQKILANPSQEDERTEYDKWTKQQQELDEEIIQLQSENRTAAQTVLELKTERETGQERIHALDIERSTLEQAEKQIQLAHDELIAKLTTIRPSWKAIDDLYLKEGSVYGPLVDLQTKMTRKKEEVLNEERLARRFVDDYDEQMSFFSDPFLANKINDWQNQLFVITGPAFYANLSNDEQRKYHTYPLWALTLITREADHEKLLTKVFGVKDRLQYPIALLTLEDVKDLNEEVFAEKWIAPTHWGTNLHANSFRKWQANLRELAEEKTTLRKEKEQEYTHVTDVLRVFEQFFHTYPKRYKDEVKEDLRNLQINQEELHRKNKKILIKIEQTNKEIQAKEEQIATNEDIKAGFEHRIERATEYFQMKREITEIMKRQTEREQKIAEHEKEIRQLNRSLIRFEEDIATIEQSISSNEQQMTILRADALYKKVKQYRPVQMTDAIDVMVERRETLLLQLQGIRQTYDGLVAKYEQTKKDIVRVTNTMAQLLKNYDNIDTEKKFPVDGERLLDEVRERVKIGANEKECAREEVAQSKETFDLQTGSLQTVTDRFNKEFSHAPLYTFNIELAEVAESLQRAKRKLETRKVYVERETERIDKDMSDIEAAIQELRGYEIAHQFNSTIVSAIALSEKERIDFTYERMQFVETITKRLTEKSEQLKKGEERIDKAKQSFRIFCRNNITERKLRERAMEGIEIKTTYEEVLQYEQNMMTTVERADKVARNYISDKDKEVQAFINSMHNHLLTVTEQLRIIPKKTRVKVGEQSKDIFRFLVPEWTEEDGKNRIRNHMDWILEKLEAGHFKDESGLEDSGKIRKEIETWLQTTSLLRVVMDNEGMKVSCRKVTNDNKVTSRLTTWEQSNQWSGGEKWSKNMTLFLGILNFVAEKKQPLDKNMKRHRAVILDNPFGKASSDHVLSPVFFIADQLGFQIIAFTAHADGKFLQDYFPIIYSLKLRATADETKQVMTKEKSLHHAYFEDHEPAEVKRLEEREQMELF